MNTAELRGFAIGTLGVIILAHLLAFLRRRGEPQCRELVGIGPPNQEHDKPFCFDTTPENEPQLGIRRLKVELDPTRGLPVSVEGWSWDQQSRWSAPPRGMAVGSYRKYRAVFALRDDS